MDAMKYMKVHFFIFVTFALLMLLVINFEACKGSGSMGKGYERTGESPSKSDQRTSTNEIQSSKNIVNVNLSDYKIDMPSSLKPGEIAFRVSNTGDKDHSFEIHGNGVDKKLEDNLSPGETRTLTVDLESGQYVALCPLFGHDLLGMKKNVTVDKQ